MMLGAIETNGSVAEDEGRLNAVNAKFGGYIEKLYVDRTGQPVRRGQPLLTVYSPDLVATERELLLAVENVRRLSSGSPQVASDASSLSGEIAEVREHTPAPIVLLEVPQGTYWHAWHRFLVDEVLGRGLISEHDFDLFRITDDVGEACEAIVGFYANYHSIRFVGDVLVVRLRHAPDDALLAKINEEFADICTEGAIERSEPRPAEVSTNDHVDLPRIAFHFDRLSYGRLRQLIDVLNGRAETATA